MSTEKSDSNKSEAGLQGCRAEEEAIAPPRFMDRWVLPGAGMFCEGYLMLAFGMVGPLQHVLWPGCYDGATGDCGSAAMVFLAPLCLSIVAIMIGMLFWGFQGDTKGRRGPARLGSVVMLSGAVLLTFTAYATTPKGYFAYFLIAMIWFGIGVGGEYPLTAALATEQSATTPELRANRGRHVTLVLSNQGWGNFICSIVVLIGMACFGQAGASRDFEGSQKVLALTYGLGAVFCLLLVVYRYCYLNESQAFLEEKQIEAKKADLQAEKVSVHGASIRTFWPRLLAAVIGCVFNDVAFYTIKYYQWVFIFLGFPTSTAYQWQQWIVLNNLVGLLGYYAAAALVDKAWYGRRAMQTVGFLAMALFYLIVCFDWLHIVPAFGSVGPNGYQTLLYLITFFNQFGPNTTTWLVASEIFPTNIRATYHSVASAIGKIGAIVASLLIYYAGLAAVPSFPLKYVFLIAAILFIVGAIVTMVLLPDTTGLSLEENDRMQRCVLEGKPRSYHGEAVNPRHLSLFEVYVLGWDKEYNPEMDRTQFEAEVNEYAMADWKEGVLQMERMQAVKKVVAAC